MLGVGFLIYSALVGGVQGKAAPQAVFNKPIQLLGDMINNNIDFVDGLKLNVYSPVDREVIVTMNKSPLNGTFVTGTTGTGYRTVRGYSYIIKTDPPGNDMIAKISIPYDPTKLQNMSIQQADTFIGKLADDKKEWVVSTPRQTNQRAQFQTSMSQMTSLDGEYVILGRKGTDNGNIFVPYGTGAQFSVKFTGGPGRQDAEFLDGLRFAVQSEFPLRMNVDLKYPIDEKEIPEGMMALNAYAWVVNTTGQVELTPPSIPAGPTNGTLVPTPRPTNTTVVSIEPPNSLPAPANPAKPFTFGTSRRRQLAQLQQKASGSSDLRQAPTAPLKPDAPAPAPPLSPSVVPEFPVPPIPGPPIPPIPGPPVPPIPGPPVPPIPGPPVPPIPGPPVAPPPPPAPPKQGIITTARIDFPLNLDTVRQAMRGTPAASLSELQLLSTIRFTVGRRATGAEPNSPFAVVPLAVGPGITPNTGNDASGDAQSLQLIDGRLVFEGVTQLDGEYVILIPMESAMKARIVAAKAGLIKANSGVEKKARVGAAMGVFAVAVWFSSFL
ncbi:hypothetical protein Vi05172_g6626 [Venturia inaequalis]|nr:hypothetical protein Vi05172_g6626 [Venturia inaequalis]